MSCHVIISNDNRVIEMEWWCSVHHIIERNGERRPELGRFRCGGERGEGTAAEGRPLST